MFPRYPFPAKQFIQIAAASLLGRSRSFRQDAAYLTGRLRPPLQVGGREHIPASGPCLLTLNHYSRPGFVAWWLAIAVSAVVPPDVHWIITAAWTFPGRWYRPLLRPASAWVLGQIAGVYGFTLMPPMPPDPAEVQARAEAVRGALAYARRTPEAVIGLAPEGRDLPGGALGWPPPGAGRFIRQLAGTGLEIVPIGAYEESGAFRLSFGPRYRLDPPAGLNSNECDREVSRIVMGRIARQLPPRLRGEFASE